MAKDTPSPQPQSKPAPAPAQEVAKKPSDEDKLEVTIVSNYGRHRPGARIEVTRREYLLFRKVDDEGRISCPVFITDEDAEIIRAAEQAKVEAERIAAHKRDERSTADGWQAYQQKSLEQVRAVRLREQQSQQEVLLGKPVQATAEDLAKKFAENVSAARTG